jgi:hypothetical protein
MTNKEKNDKIVAIHQPNFFPWLGYFHKIYTSDVFVLFDTAQYSKKAFINRTKIRKAPLFMETKYLLIPLRKHSSFDMIKDLYVDKFHDFRSKILKAINAVYAKSEFFGEYYPLIEKMVLDTKDMDSLFEINLHLIKKVMEILSLDTKLAIASSLPVEGKRQDFVINAVKHLNGKVYLSGCGAKDYQKDSDFNKEGIKLIYQDIYNFIQEHPYKQTQGDFINGLSILDALFNIGKKGIIEIFENHDSKVFRGLNPEVGK